MTRCEDLNITFIHLPKNGGSSISNWLVENAGGEEYYDAMRHTSLERLAPLFGDMGWSFCVVRNPWDRIISWWKYWTKQKRTSGSFAEYLDRALSNPSAISNNMISNQLQNMAGVDCVLRFESLNKDFEIVQDKVNCYKSLPFDNVSWKTDYTKHYETQKMIDIVGDYYEQDIKHFGYKFGE